MSDSKKISAFAKVSDSSKDLSTTPEENPSSEYMSQALPVMSESLPEDPFSLRTPIRKLEGETASANPQEESTYDNCMFNDFPIKQILGAVFSDSSDEEDPPVDLRALIRNLEDSVTDSQENMLDGIVHPLDKTWWFFVCNFRPARYLKFAIEALSNPEVSCQGSGRIDVDNSGFNITVHNLRNSVVGHLRLDPDRFRCTKPLNGKRFSFLELSRELADVEDEGNVYLGNHTDTDQLDIRVLVEGAGDTRRFFVELSYNFAVIRKFPEMPLFFTAIVPFDQCRLMIHHLLQQKTPRVSVDIKDNIATLRAGNDNNSWTATYPMIRAYGSRAMEAGENYSTSFQWTNASVAALLQKASEMDDGFVLLFHAERPKSIILRFYLGEVGYLEFMRECSTTFSWTPLNRSPEAS